MHPPLYFNGSIVCKSNSHKHLGVILDPKLSFNHHINEKINKANKLVGTLKYLSNYISTVSLITIYKSFIRPHFDYADIVYHIPHSINVSDSSLNLNSLMEKIERVQYQAALAITGCWQGSSKSKLYKQLGWESLSERRWAHRLCQIFKMTHGLTPSYLTRLLPTERNIQLRNQPRYHEIRCNTNRYKNSFLPDAIKSYNSIGIDISSSVSLPIFKSKIFKLIRPSFKSTYGLFDPFGIKYLYQLRVGLSPLKFYKKRHNFSNTPSDICDCHAAVEDVSHYLLYCTFYNIQRSILFSKSRNILSNYNLLHLITDVDFYLYGHQSLSPFDNKEILASTIKFIKDSKRFSPS